MIHSSKDDRHLKLVLKHNTLKVVSILNYEICIKVYEWILFLNQLGCAKLKQETLICEGNLTLKYTGHLLGICISELRICISLMHLKDYAKGK